MIITPRRKQMIIIVLLISVKKGPNVKKLKKNTNAVAEDGEVSSGGSEDFDSEDETEEQIRYDPNKLIEIPGFNVPMPPGWQDDHRRFGMPPLQPHQMKENALLALKTTKVLLLPLFSSSLIPAMG